MFFAVVALFCYASLTLVVSATTKGDAKKIFDTQFHTIGKGSTSLSSIFAEVRSKASEEKHHLSAGFQYAEFLLRSLKMEKRKFAVQEKLRPEQVRRLSDIHGENSGTTVYDSRAVYTLKDDIFFLDSMAHPQHLTALTDKHIRYCHPAHPLELKAGHIIVGSNDGAWHRRQLLQSSSSLAAPAGTLVVGRRVVRRLEEEGAGCTTYFTEPVHVLELFESFRIESLVDHPKNTYKETPAKAEEAAAPAPSPRKLDLQVPTRVHKGAGMPKPDVLPSDLDPYSSNNIQMCDPPKDHPWMEGGKPLKVDDMGMLSISYDSYSDGGTIDADWFFSKSDGCMSFTYTAPGLNWNWKPDSTGDPMKGHIVNPKLTLGAAVTGVECNECYLYAGAQLYAIVEYRNSATAMFAEVRLSGAAGFNVEVEINNPGVSGSSSTTLLQPDEGFGPAMKIGTTGIELSLMNGGLVGTATGSGSLSGTASFGAGLTASLSIAAMYNQPASPSLNVIFPDPVLSWVKPYFKATSFKPAGASTINIGLSATEFVRVSYVVGVSPFAVSLDMVNRVVSHVNSGLGQQGSSTSAQLYVDPPPAPANAAKRSLQGSAAPLQRRALSPGDQVRLRYVYKDAVPGEKHRLFYSVTSLLTGASQGIMQRDFVNSDSGAGSHEADWVVPSDLAFRGYEQGSGGGLVFRVRSSSWIHDELTASGDPLPIEAFTEHDGIFEPSPATQDGGTLPVDQPFVVRWNAKLLHLFDGSQPLTPQYHGKERQSTLVRFVLKGRSAVDGEEFSLDLGASFPNSGEASLVIPSSKVDRGVSRAYWLEVSDAAFGSTMGWTHGYQQLSSQPGSPLTAVLALPPALQKSFLSREKPALTFAQAAGLLPAAAARQLDSCDTSTSVPVSSSMAVGGQPQELSASIASVPIMTVPLSSAPAPAATVGAPQSTCVDVSSSGGTKSANGGSSSDSSNSPSAGTVAGAIIGVLLILGGGAVAYYFLIHKKYVTSAAEEAGASPEGRSRDDKYNASRQSVHEVYVGETSMTGQHISMTPNPMAMGLNPMHQQRQYVQPQPQYEQHRPQYEQPQYEQPQPRYEQPHYEQPQYEQPQPRYEQPHYEQPHYEQPQPQYEQPQPQYEQPQPQYEQPQPQYEQPQPHYEQPQYEQPQPHYEQPQPHYEQPQPHYEQPQPQYEQPQPQYEQPQYPPPEAPRPSALSPPQSLSRTPPALPPGAMPKIHRVAPGSSPPPGPGPGPGFVPRPGPGPGPGPGMAPGPPGGPPRPEPRKSKSRR